MADKFLSSLVGGGLYKLAPDLDRIADQSSSSSGYKQIIGIDATAGLTTAISLSGKWLLTAAIFDSTLAEAMTVKITIDGVVTINSSFTAATSGIAIIGLNQSISNPFNDAYMYCEETLLIELETTSDNSVAFRYTARPIA